MFFLVPMVLFGFVHLKSMSEQTAATLQEKAGIEYILVLNSLLKEVTDHRGALIGLLRGNDHFRDRVKLKNGVIDALFSALAEQDKANREKLEIGTRSDELLKHWVLLKQGGQKMSDNAALDAHNKIIAELNELVRHVSISSKLIFDPEMESYFLASISFKRLPLLADAVGNLRRFSSDIIAKHEQTLIDATLIAIKKEEILSNLDALDFELKKAYQADLDGDTRGKLESVGNAAIAATQNYMQYLDNQLDSESLTQETEQFYNQGTVTLDKIWALDNVLNPELISLFKSRLARQQMQEIMAYALVFVVLVTTLYLFMGFYLSVHQAIARVAEGAQAVADGQLSTRIDVEVKDEMANIATSFNAMAGILEERAQRDEYDKLEEARKTTELRERLAKLSAHIENVASGDLSKRIRILGDDDLGRLGVNLNAMTESLADVTSGTTEAINIIYSAVEELQYSINEQSSGASEQAVAVNETTAALVQISGMAAQTMEQVQILGETADRSRRESEEGSATVAEGITVMTGILQRMNGIAQTILALSEQIQQIGEITGVVTNLAQQSKMLALNASIEAAKAGEAGKGFAVVAAEVRELAEQSQQSTAQVQKILRDIRHATDRAVMATEEGSKGVDAGMLSVQRSGEMMQKLRAVVLETATASHQISAVVKQQFMGLEQVTSAMKDINKVTTQFVNSTQQSKVSSVGISKVADRLRDSISVYKL
ncbi:MAG: methyl-accepting chemotaxis protein [Gallionella sp.]|nr:methyl-accepting chemotaxis protein [Gallionella sp.]